MCDDDFCLYFSSLHFYFKLLLICRIIHSYVQLFICLRALYFSLARHIVLHAVVTRTPGLKCGGRHFACISEPFQRIPLAYRCDGDGDCTGREDEADCGM
ncbi:unnamed protein product [Protopolystoma xenopodis]|uniref:Uncharacterized protein n=1 Tax=Protopolystoma xenopodis TaxID=117903 RepID=A0A3S5BP02_9PLAT|nr:unnamed protein product [Protopolystoma xenopodis]